MKLMMQKWCWIGLILCASGTAWAAKGDDEDDKPAAETKAKKSSKADSDEDAKNDSKDDATKDDATKDESGDEDEDAPKPATKKASSKAELSTNLKESSSVINIGALLGYGTSTFTHLGIGLRGGITLGGKEGLYLGLTGTLFTGTSVSEERLTGTAEQKQKTIIIGADVGYDVMASDDIVLRPYMNLGAALNTQHECAAGSCWDNNGGHLTLAPGAQGMYLLGSGFWAGADMRYQIIMGSSDATALVMSLALGMRF
jgi:hypothetical protein